MQQDNIKKSVVKPGSIFHTDCWRAYIGVAPDLAAAKYYTNYCAGNHSVEFFAGVDGTHTNNIEGEQHTFHWFVSVPMFTDFPLFYCIKEHGQETKSTAGGLPW